MSASGSRRLEAHGVSRRAALAAVTATVLVLVGCAGQPAPTQTVTVTATPDPAAVAAAVEEAMAQAEAAQAAEEAAAAAAQTGEAITPLLAWTLCVAAAQVDFGAEYWDPVDYTSDQVTDQADGTFLATPGFAPLADQGFGAQGRCVVSGEVGDPNVDYQGGMDFG